MSLEASHDSREPSCQELSSKEEKLLEYCKEAEALGVPREFLYDAKADRVSFNDNAYQLKRRLPHPITTAFLYQSAVLCGRSSSEAIKEVVELAEFLSSHNMAGPFSRTIDEITRWGIREQPIYLIHPHWKPEFGEELERMKSTRRDLPYEWSIANEAVAVLSRFSYEHYTPKPVFPTLVGLTKALCEENAPVPDREELVEQVVALAISPSGAGHPERGEITDGFGFGLAASFGGVRNFFDGFRDFRRQDPRTIERKKEVVKTICGAVDRKSGATQSLDLMTGGTLDFLTRQTTFTSSTDVLEQLAQEARDRSRGIFADQLLFELASCFLDSSTLPPAGSEAQFLRRFRNALDLGSELLSPNDSIFGLHRESEGLALLNVFARRDIEKYATLAPDVLQETLESEGFSPAQKFNFLCLGFMYEICGVSSDPLSDMLHKGPHAIDTAMPLLKEAIGGRGSGRLLRTAGQSFCGKRILHPHLEISTRARHRYIKELFKHASSFPGEEDRFFRGVDSITFLAEQTWLDGLSDPERGPLGFAHKDCGKGRLRAIKAFFDQFGILDSSRLALAHLASSASRESRRRFPPHAVLPTDQSRPWATLREITRVALSSREEAMGLYHPRALSKLRPYLALGEMGDRVIEFAFMSNKLLAEALYDDIVTDIHDHFRGDKHAPLTGKTPHWGLFYGSGSKHERYKKTRSFMEMLDPPPDLFSLDWTIPPWKSDGPDLPPTLPIPCKEEESFSIPILPPGKLKRLVSALRAGKLVSPETYEDASFAKLSPFELECAFHALGVAAPKFESPYRGRIELIGTQQGSFGTSSPRATERMYLMSLPKPQPDHGLESERESLPGEIFLPHFPEDFTAHDFRTPKLSQRSRVGSLGLKEMELQRRILHFALTHTDEQIRESLRSKAHRHGLSDAYEDVTRASSVHHLVRIAGSRGKVFREPSLKRGLLAALLNGVVFEELPNGVHLCQYRGLPPEQMQALLKDTKIACREYWGRKGEKHSLRDALEDLVDYAFSSDGQPSSAVEEESSRTRGSLRVRTFVTQGIPFRFMGHVCDTCVTRLYDPRTERPGMCFMPFVNLDAPLNEPLFVGGVGLMGLYVKDSFGSEHSALVLRGINPRQSFSSRVQIGPFLEEIFDRADVLRDRWCLGLLALPCQSVAGDSLSNDPKVVRYINSRYGGASASVVEVVNRAASVFNGNELDKLLVVRTPPS